MKKPKRAMVIGMDCALPHLMQQHIAEGHLPNFAKLFAGGVVADNCLVPFPTITPPNWATIATGAWPGTHGVTDFWQPHAPGTSPENVNTRQSFSSSHLQAESLWDAADKAGKRCIVLNYPGSWPSQMQNGILMGGCALSYGHFRDNLPNVDILSSVCASQLITTGIYPRAIRGKFAPAQGWANLDEPGEQPLAMAAPLNFPSPLEPPAPTTWHVLARQSDADGYDTVTLTPTKDLKDAFCTLRVGEWSPKIFTTIDMLDGSKREVMFRCKLMELSDDAEDFRLFVTTLVATTGFAHPPEVAGKINSPAGLPVHGNAMIEFQLGMIDLDTYVECCNMHDEWLADAATSLLGLGEWDLLFMHAHSPDWTYHVIMNEMDPATCSSEKAYKKAWKAHLSIYEGLDRMVGQILEAADEETLVVLVSDHGAVADGPMFNPHDALAPAGLVVLQDTENTDVRNTEVSTLSHYVFLSVVRPVLAKSKAIAQRSCHIYINLKGRDPEGIVEPDDYERVQRQIIDTLSTYVDPRTGTRPVALALTKEDARILGLYGDRVGDVVYAIYPEFGSQHGAILPTARWGIGSLKGLLVFNGPGIARGVHLERTVHLTDIVPTICYLLDLPLPQQAEGAVIYQAFKDPDFHRIETEKLLEGIARMEQALRRDVRESWDKHDCG